MYFEVKPVFHWNLPLRRLIFALPTRKKVHKQCEMYMKCTWPTPEDPTPPIFHWLASGVGVGADARNVHHLTQNIPTCWYPCVR